MDYILLTGKEMDEIYDEVIDELVMVTLLSKEALLPLTEGEQMVLLLYATPRPSVAEDAVVS